jgi:hypothetical protein
VVAGRVERAHRLDAWRLSLSLIMSIKRNLVLIAIGGVAFVFASALSVVVNSLVRSVTGTPQPDPPAQMKETPEAKAKREAKATSKEENTASSKTEVKDQAISDKSQSEIGLSGETAASPPPPYAPPPPPRAVGPGNLGYEPAPYYPPPVQTGPGNLN